MNKVYTRRRTDAGNEPESAVRCSNTEKSLHDQRNPSFVLAQPKLPLVSSHMKFLLVTILATTLASCTGLYNSNRPTTPLLHHANEINGSIGGNGYGFEAQAAYALTNHIGLIGALNIMPAQTGTDFQPAFSGNLFELGAGYFDSSGEIGHIEAYGTLGYGTSSGNIPGNDLFGFVVQAGPGYAQTPYGYNRFVDGKFFRQTLQGNMGIEGKMGAIGIGLRESLVDMFQWHQLDQATMAGNSDIEIRGSKVGVFAEPLFFARVGYRWIKLYIEYWLTLPVTRYSDTWTSANASLGLSFDF